MRLKHATFIAMIGTSLFVLRGVFSMLDITLYKFPFFAGLGGDNLLIYPFPACLLVFLIVFYRQQV